MTIKQEQARDSQFFFESRHESCMSERDAREYDKARDARVEMQVLELIDDDDYLNDIIINNDYVLGAIRRMVKQAHLFPATKENISTDERTVIMAVIKEIEAQAERDID